MYRLLQAKRELKRKVIQDAVRQYKLSKLFVLYSPFTIFVTN